MKTKNYLTLALIFACFANKALAQKVNWQNLDLKKDTIFGISTEKAYRELLPHRKANPVVVAIMDSGIDTTYEDLKDVLWHNRKEKPANGRDDDHNGYADDIFGWDFIGGPKGDVNVDNFEITRLVRQNQAFYDSLSYARVPQQYVKGYQEYRNMKLVFDSRLAKAEAGKQKASNVLKGIDTVCSKLKTNSPTLEQVKMFIPANDSEGSIQRGLIRWLTVNPDLSILKNSIEKELQSYYLLADYQLNVNFDPRNIVGDNYENVAQRNYGNNDVYGPNALHGTHVSGIIGAERDNGIGINGIADHVRLMMVRVVPEGDERDKDVANGIRYAVDNGAKVINMSFGKPYSKDKKAVDEAVKYAMSKDVLIIHAAGNDGLNVDDPENTFVPTKYYADSSGISKAWINVGASGMKDDSTLVAFFSNYGKNNVDVFAPGVQIYSTVPGSKYAFENGTSMAAPVVTGLAALIREYYPRLTALQVKDIIMRSVVKPSHQVMVKENGETKKVWLRDICVSGGVVNAYNALKLAANYNENLQ
jgi:subtilisin family serine protease